MDPDRLLQRIPDVRLQLGSAGEVRVEVAEGLLDCGPAGLHVLERFGQPGTIRELAADRAVSAQQWVDRLDAAIALFRSGILRDIAAPEMIKDPPSHEFDNPWIHIRMLEDVPRTIEFIRAIEETVRPGNTVVDIGTGTGILAMAAARAGAKHVYAIEAGRIASQAEKVIAANGMAERITVLRGWSSTVSLPERADVLVTETIGSDPLDERILEIVADARRRLITPDAPVIPTRLRIFATPIEVPDAAIAGHVYTAAALQDWGKRYGFDFSPLLDDRRLRGHRVKGTVARGWPRLSPPVMLADLDLTGVTTTSLDAEVEVAIEKHGRLDGALLHFEAVLGPGIAISSDPMRARDDNSWPNVLTLVQPTTVQPNDRVLMNYRRRAGTRVPGLSVAVVR
jgi:hypothetical protein